MSDAVDDEDLPQPDRVEGAPHPRETAQLFGQDAAESEFRAAHASERLHHGWLLRGPRGTGKATLAWRIARFLLTQPQAGAPGGLFADEPAPETAATDSLDVDPEHPVARLIAARAAPGLFHIRRGRDPKSGKLRQVITVDDVRGLAHFFHMSASDGGRRVVIVDSADEMNPQAANALLKMLEEPPARATLLLVSHQPSRLLPTIRSRCRELRLAPLGPADMARALDQAGAGEAGAGAALAELSGGSVGEALRLANLGGLDIYAELVGLLATLPRLDRARALRLAEAAATRGAEDRLDLLIDLIERVLSRLARAGASGTPPLTEAAPGEAALMARLSPTPAAGRAWARAAQEVSARIRHGRAVNLDPASLILDTILRLQTIAA